jgi:hypothetical protein
VRLFATVAAGLAIAVPASVPVSTLHALAAGVKSLHMHVGMTPQLRRLCDLTQRDLRSTEHDARLRVVCPLLVPDVRLMLKSEYAGTFGLLDSAPHGDFYGITVNNGGDDPHGFFSLHWIVGKGTWALIRARILSDKENVVKGKPTFLGVRTLLGHRARLYHFPPHPAGGAFGSHTIAFVQAGRTFAFASVHGNHLDASIAMAVAYALQLGG